MTHRSPFSIRLLALLILTGLPALQAESPPEEAASPHFWDEIPASPSTTAAKKIKDDYWHGQFQRVNRELAAAHRPELVFFGDSITWNWSLGKATGKELWEERYAKYRPLNMGNSGDITPVMLHRITHGNLDFPPGHAPKVAVLLCGTNNFVVTKSAGGDVQWELGTDCPPEDVAAGARAIAQVFRRRLPTTRVIMLGILPVANKKKWPKCQEVNQINAAVTSNPDELVFLDLQDRFLQADGTLDRTLFTDGTHLTPEGYKVWADSIEPIVTKMMTAPPLAPVKIMLIGDSVTEGRNSAVSYRRYLDGQLRRQGHLIDFVGSRSRHHDNKTAPDSYQFDPDHEGHWGKDSRWLAKHLPAKTANPAPDLAVLHFGTVDILTGSDPAEPLTDTIFGNICTSIGALRTNNPDVKIVVSQITSIPGKEQVAALLNNKITSLANTHSTKQSPLIIARPPRHFDPATDLENALPTSTGARKIATALAEALHGTLTHP